MMEVNKERYEQELKSWNRNEEQVNALIREWGVENFNNGYAIFDYDCTGLLGIEAIGELCRFETDGEAAIQAEKDGIKIIPVNELPENFGRNGDDYRWFGWIDTVENRKAIEKYCS